MREVIDALQTLRGIAKVSAVTIVAELGELSRLREARQLMAHSGTVSELQKRWHHRDRQCRSMSNADLVNWNRSEDTVREPDQT
jgi:transposase